MSEDAGTKNIKDKIRHLLQIFPRISPSMLQIGLGTSLPPSIWRPILQELLDQKIVLMEEVPGQSVSGRPRSYEVLSLI